MAITHVNVIGPGGEVTRDQTILVHGSRITNVAATSGLSIPAGARVVDGSGLFAIPGLWDMHVHTVARGSASHYAELFLANGVTGVRDMGDDLAVLRSLRDSLARGLLLGPRLVYGGRLDGPGPLPPYALAVADTARVSTALDSLQRAGIDFVKIPASLTRGLYSAIVQEAQRRGLPFAGHVPHDITMIEAAQAGQASVEHEDDLMAACGTRELEIKQRIAAAMRTDQVRLIAPVMRAAADSMRVAADPTRCDGVARTLASRTTWFTPTLVVYQPYARGFDSTFVNDARLQYVPESLLENWRLRLRERTPEDHKAAAAYFDFGITHALHDAGVPFLAGTDAPLPYVLPGFSLHDELELLVRAGLKPQAALHAATAGAAQFLGANDSLGSIAPGKLADLVLLEADPLMDIRNTTRIRAVVLNGRYLDRTSLDRLLARVRRVTTGVRP